MRNYQHAIYYRSIETETYEKVSHVWLPTCNAAALDMIIAIFVGIIQLPQNLKCTFAKDGSGAPRKFRHMRPGDVVEVAGKAYVFTDGQFSEIDFQSDHQYGNVQGWEFDDLEREAYLIEQYDRWEREQAKANAEYERQRAAELGNGDDEQERIESLLDAYDQAHNTLPSLGAGNFQD